MAKKQLKKINQPKKYLQGGYNMGSVSMMRQNPYYLGQVNQNAAEEKLDETRQQAEDIKQTAVQAKRDSKAQKTAEMDQALQNSVSTLGQAAIADKKAGVLGKLWVPGATASSGIVAPTLQSSIAANSANAVANTGVSTVTGIGGAPITSGIGASAPGAINIGTTGIGGAPIVTNTATNAGTTVAGNAAKTVGGGLSGLGAAGIGIAANIGGTIIKNRTNDDSAYTFTKKEARGNVAGSALSSAGTAAGIALNPAVLTATGGLSALAIPVAAGIGALKARKENQAAEEEAKRLQREQADIAAAYQSAAINSRLAGVDTGFGYNSSTNMNNNFTNQYQVAKTGGVTGIQEDRRTKKVPGGKIVPIEGTDAVEFIGRSHEKGGVTIDKYTEVEGGETMDQVAMNNNNKQDYIFSKYLKLGGKSFAQRHKEILKSGGSQQEIQKLAKLQEEAAGRNPQQIAKYGGIHKYVDGGTPGDPPKNPYQAGTFNMENPGAPTSEDLKSAKLVWVNGAHGSRYQVYQFPNGSTWDPNNMDKKIASVKEQGDQINAQLFALPGALASGVSSGLAGIARMGYNMVNDKALGTGNSGSMGALPSGNTQAVGNYGGNVFAAKPQTESFNVFGNYPAMIKQAAALSGQGSQPQSQGSSNNYTGPTGTGEGQKYFNNVGQGQPDPYNTAENAKKMGWGDDVAGYTNSGFGFGPNYKAPAAPSKGGTKKAKPAYDRDAWRDKGVGLMTDEELTAENLGPKDSIPEGAQYRRPPGATPPPVSGIQVAPPANITGTFRDNKDGTFSYGSDQTGWETSSDKNIAKSKYQTKQLNAANQAAASTGSTGYMAPAGVAGSAPNANAAPVTTAGQTIVNGNPPSNTPAGTQSAVSSQTTTNAGATTTGTTTANTNPTAPTINNQNTKFQYTATGKGNLDYSDRNTAGGIWAGDRYEKEWKPLVASTMDDPAKADIVLKYLNNYTGTDAADVKAKLQGKSREQQIAVIKRLATDSKVGPFHNAVYNGIQESNTPPPTTNTPPTTGPEKPEEETTETTTNVEKKKEPCGPGTYLSTDGSCQPVPAFKQGTRINGSLVAGLGQLVPVGAALLNPYKIAPGIAGAPSIKGPLMPRVNMNQERASNIQQNVAYRNAVINQNAGPGALAAMQMANTKTNQQMLAIAKQEQDQNKQLAAQEASLGMDASKFNADNSLKTQMFNKEFNQKERQYRREDLLGALDAGAARIAGIVKDERSYKANERLARALDETHSYDRFSIYEQLTKQAKQKNSPYYGVPDAELRRMAAGISEQIYGEMGVVAEAPAATNTQTTQTAKTGGVRQYVSRLGELKSARATKAKL